MDPATIAATVMSVLAPYAIKGAKALNIKIVAHSHSQPENLFMEMPKIIQPVLNNLWNRYLMWVYSKAESIIYPSEMARGLLQKLNKKDQPSTVISNGINLNHFKKMESINSNQKKIMKNLLS